MSESTDSELNRRVLDALKAWTAEVDRRLDKIQQGITDILMELAKRTTYPPEIDAEINQEWWKSKKGDGEYLPADRVPTITSELRKAKAPITIGGYEFRLSRNGRWVTRKAT